MKCKIEGCDAKKFYEGGIFSTSMGVSSYVDADDNHHFHDPNSQWINYTCERGHTFSKSLSNKCPVPGCDFGKPAEIR